MTGVRDSEKRDFFDEEKMTGNYNHIFGIFGWNFFAEVFSLKLKIANILRKLELRRNATYSLEDNDEKSYLDFLYSRYFTTDS